MKTIPYEPPPHRVHKSLTPTSMSKPKREYNIHGPRRLHYKRMVEGRDGMSYKDHLKKAFERGAVEGGYKKSDFFTADDIYKFEKEEDEN